MNPTISTNIMSLIQIHYPGGVSAFKAAGGSLFAFPNTDDYIICCSELPSTFMKKLHAGAIRYGASVKSYTTSNFQCETNEQVRQWTIKFMQLLRETGILKVTPFFSPCTIYVEAKLYDSDSPEIKSVKDFIKKSDIIVRAHLLCKDMTLAIEQERKVKEIQPDARPITDDDVLNVKIALHEINSVEDFLKAF